MHLSTILLFAVLGYIAWRTSRTVRSSSTPREKALAIRSAAVFWLLGFAFLGALIVLPNRVRVFLLLPAFFVAIAVGKGWHDNRQRLRREKREQVDLERMKRVG